MSAITPWPRSLVNRPIESVGFACIRQWKFKLHGGGETLTVLRFDRKDSVARHEMQFTQNYFVHSVSRICQTHFNRVRHTGEASHFAYIVDPDHLTTLLDCPNHSRGSAVQAIVDAAT